MVDRLRRHMTVIMVGVSAFVAGYAVGITTKDGWAGALAPAFGYAVAGLFILMLASLKPDKPRLR